QDSPCVRGPGEILISQVADNGIAEREQDVGKDSDNNQRLDAQRQPVQKNRSHSASCGPRPASRGDRLADQSVSPRVTRSVAMLPCARGCVQQTIAEIRNVPKSLPPYRGEEEHDE